MLKTYKIITIVLVTDFCLFKLLGLSLAGQISDKILFWVWFIMTIPVIIKYVRHTKWLKWYLGLLGISIILSIIPMGAPLIDLLEFATDTTFERRIENYRLRHDTEGFIDQNSIIKVVRNIGIIELEYAEIHFGENPENHSLYDVGEIGVITTGNSVLFELEIDGYSYTKQTAKLNF